MEDQRTQIDRATAHFLAARRLRDKLKEEPTLAGLEACARVHIQRLAALSVELCDGGELEAPALIAMPG